ncbi:MAG: hypothetical protein ACO1N1_24840 [Dyadobacter fermentans]
MQKLVAIRSRLIKTYTILVNEVKTADYFLSKQKSYELRENFHWSVTAITEDVKAIDSKIDVIINADVSLKRNPACPRPAANKLIAGSLALIGGGCGSGYIIGSNNLSSMTKVKSNQDPGLWSRILIMLFGLALIVITYGNYQDDTWMDKMSSPSPMDCMKITHRTRGAGTVKFPRKICGDYQGSSSQFDMRSKSFCSLT